MSGEMVPTDPQLEKWREFAAQYIIDWDHGGAYKRCEWTTAKTLKQATTEGAKMIRIPEVQELIRAEHSARKQRLLIEKIRLDQDMVLKEQYRIATADIRNYMSWDNDDLVVKASSELTDDQAAAIAEVEFTDRSTPFMKNRRVKIKLHPKQIALESIAKHLGMYTEKREVTHSFGTIEVPSTADPDDWDEMIRKQIGASDASHAT